MEAQVALALVMLDEANRPAMVAPGTTVAAAVAAAVAAHLHLLHTVDGVVSTLLTTTIVLVRVKDVITRLVNISKEAAVRVVVVATTNEDHRHKSIAKSVHVMKMRPEIRRASVGAK